MFKNPHMTKCKQ